MKQPTTQFKQCATISLSTFSGITSSYCLLSMHDARVFLPLIGGDMHLEEGFHFPVHEIINT